MGVRLTNTVSTQVQVQGHELANPYIQPINELLEYIKGTILKIHSSFLLFVFGFGEKVNL